jgi:hypothetical protein
MNERIKECWLKAAREDSSDNWDTQEEFIERFAKLIIQKCKSQLALIGITNFENKDITWTVETAIVNIEEHFGVSDDQ